METSYRGRRERDFAIIRPECALVTATDAKHAPYLFNAINSIRERFPAHPTLYVFDLGMTWLQRRELQSAAGVELRKVDRFVPHWKTNWSWKPYILTQVSERYVLYFDAANIVLYRPLHLWFLTIARSGYFLIKNGQRMQDITPSNYWAKFDLDAARSATDSTFGAGLFGFDRRSPAGEAVSEALQRTKAGWNLGRSRAEQRRTYDASVIHDCLLFRADQTLLNLAFRKRYGDALVLRDEVRYCGRGGRADDPRQYLWYSRRLRQSLIYFWRPLRRPMWPYLAGRVVAYARILVGDAVRAPLSWWLRRKAS